MLIISAAISGQQQHLAAIAEVALHPLALLNFDF
jgi:hypothetical protein